MTEKVSIIIPVYNGSNFLDQAIRSALAQTYPETEVIVVNDGSSDDGKTAAIARSYGDGIRYFEKENGGVASALNYGIERMEGDYFSWLSHDDRYYPDKVAAEMESIHAAGRDCIALCDSDNINKKGAILTEWRLEESYSARRIEHGWSMLYRGEIGGCALLFHKEHFERAGLFDEGLKTTQDYDLWLRLFKGRRICFTPRVLVSTRSHLAQASKTLRGTAAEEKEKLCFALLDAADEYEMTRIAGSPTAFYHLVKKKFAVSQKTREECERRARGAPGYEQVMAALPPEERAALLELFFEDALIERKRECKGVGELRGEVLRYYADRWKHKVRQLI